jgi:hypothetical protein
MLERHTIAEAEVDESTEVNQGQEQALFEFAMASLTAGLDYLQLIRLKKAAGLSITREELDAAILRNETMRAQIEAAHKRRQ